jgi:hypothetical protein
MADLPSTNSPLQTALGLLVHADDHEKILRLLHATAVTAWSRSAIESARTDTEIAAESRVYARMTQEIERIIGQPISAFQTPKSGKITRVALAPEDFDRIKASMSNAGSPPPPPQT